MTRNIALFIFFLFLSKMLTAQTDSLKWSKDTLIEWSDYKASYDKKVPFYSTTTATIQYRYHCTSYNLKEGVWHFRFEVESYFLKNESWCIPGKQSDALLQHERLHNDINEIFARKLFVALNKQTYTWNYEAEIKDIFSRVYKALQQMQLQYDEETNHFLNKAKQAEWQLNIQSQLDTLPPHHYQ
jgi:hypothetical protein